jgi:hypothetical protein
MPMTMTLTRSLLTILIPGIVAASPWLLALVQNTEATLGFDKYPSLANALLFAVVAVAGAFCEGLGTTIESRWDKERESDYSIKENWYVYLSRSLDKEPVGYRYISRLVTTMYFELSMMFAIPSFLLGGCLLASLRFPDYWCLFAILALTAGVASTLYLHWQARSSHRVLCETRQELNARAPTSTAS